MLLAETVGAEGESALVGGALGPVAGHPAGGGAHRALGQAFAGGQRAPGVHEQTVSGGGCVG